MRTDLAESNSLPGLGRYGDKLKQIVWIPEAGRVYGSLYESAASFSHQIHLSGSSLTFETRRLVLCSRFRHSGPKAGAVMGNVNNECSE